MTEDAKTVKNHTDKIKNQENEQDISLESLEITMDKRVNLAIAVFIFLLGVFILIMARGMRTGVFPDPLNTRGLPNATGILLVIFAILLAARQLRSWSELPGNLVPEEGQADEKGYPASWLRVAGVVIAALLTTLLLKPLGFLISMPFCLLLASLSMSVRSRVKLIAFPIGFTVVVWVIFGPVLGIRFPLGPLDSLARSLGLIF